MTIKFRSGPTIVLLFIIPILLQCTAPDSSRRFQAPPADSTPAAVPGGISGEQEYAGEILAYLMQVVLGKAGDPKMRDAWSAKGLDIPLDLEVVDRIMNDPEMDVKRIMVLDNNILGLARVLYYYNPRLNLFKGELRQESPFPSAELMAMRLLLLQKLHRGEKINLRPFIRKKEIIMNPAVDPGEIDPGDSGLTSCEIKLLKDIIAREPFFMGYLENPSVVDSLYRIGALNPDAFVLDKIAQAGYRSLSCGPNPPQAGPQTVTVAVVPSFVNTFEYRNADRSTHPCGFRATAAYQEVFAKIEEKILSATRGLVKAQVMSGGTRPEGRFEADPDAFAARFVGERVRILDLGQRPYAIYPENAAGAIKGICPEADFTVLILGENVYLSMNLSEADSYPSVARIFLDIMDVRYDQVDFELSQVSMFVFSRLKNLNG